MIDAETLLKNAYGSAYTKTSQDGGINSGLDSEHSKALDTIISESENNKGVYTVLITSVVYKILHPEQDVRKHQSSIPGGYSGRTFDTKHITPFLKRCGFPAMAESGWLTRFSLTESSLQPELPRCYKRAFEELLSTYHQRHRGRQDRS